MDLLSSLLSSPHIILTQLQRMCDSVQKTAQPGSEGAAELAAQSRSLSARRERWPQKIICVWKNHTVPVFSAEAITKLNQSYLAEVERVNDSRKRHKDMLRADINRKKRRLMISTQSVPIHMITTNSNWTNCVQNLQSTVHLHHGIRTKFARKFKPSWLLLLVLLTDLARTNRNN